MFVELCLKKNCLKEKKQMFFMILYSTANVL